MIISAEEFIQLRDANHPRATHDAASEDVWLGIVRGHPRYRVWVAHNKSVPLSILRQLAQDLDPRVRLSVAMKRKCDHELFNLLAGDADETIRAAIARNPNTPEDVLQRLKTDSSSMVLNALENRAR